MFMIRQLELQYYSTYFNTTDAQTKLATGKAWDPFSATNLAGLGFYHVASQYTGNNQLTPFYINAMQVPDPNVNGGQRPRMYDGAWRYHYGKDWCSRK